MNDKSELTLEDIRAVRELVSDHVRLTPVLNWDGPLVAAALGADTRVALKLELLQNTGTFKVRGALAVMLKQPAEALARGVTAVSAGNHAIAVAYAAQALGVSAKVVMMRGANALRLAKCREFGAEIILAQDVHEAFAKVRQIADTEGRVFVHPFEGPYTALGTATLGLEFIEQAPDLDAVIVPIGGGGLCAGVSAAIKLVSPGCEVFGVEPEGADNMYRSLAAGSPQKNDGVRTIADSLGPPASEPYSFALCQANVDEIVRISDKDMRRTMQLLFNEVKLAVEPAGAAATAALWGPLRQRLAGRKVGVIVCGSNIDVDSFAAHIAAISD